jgi:hypothetical protein
LISLDREDDHGEEGKGEKIGGQEEKESRPGEEKEDNESQESGAEEGCKEGCEADREEGCSEAQGAGAQARGSPDACCGAGIYRFLVLRLGFGYGRRQHLEFQFPVDSAGAWRDSAERLRSAVTAGVGLTKIGVSIASARHGQ